MTEKKLAISLGQYSTAGKKPINQDYHGAFIPTDSQLYTKGIAVALADGISSSSVSQIASQTAVSSFIEDYYSTSSAWSVKKSCQQVLSATNSWLYAQTQQSDYRFDKDKGYVCTFSGVVFKSQTAHIFHSGDSRIYKYSGKTFEQLTTDHRRKISQTESYLTRGLGIHQYLEADYIHTTINIDDVFILATDGVYEFISDTQLTDLIQKSDDNHDLNQLAKAIVELACDNGSDDNLTVLCIKINHISSQSINELHDNIMLLPAKKIKVGDTFDGFEILRALHISSRSHVYLAKEIATNKNVVIKTPSAEMRNHQAHLESFILEDWVIRRINNDHVIKAISHSHQPTFLYTVTEHIEGVTLAQWMRDNPKPSLDQVRAIVTQVAKGLQAMHRQEMVHQDLRPSNVMIDTAGTVTIIDLGSAYIAGIDEIEIEKDEAAFFTAQYAAPEYFVGEQGNAQSDIFSLGVLTYQLLSSKLPYGNNVAKKTTKKAQQSLKYQSLTFINEDIPDWVDGAVRQSLQIQTTKRYTELSEFIYDLKHPNKNFIHNKSRPLIEKNPVIFWQSISAILAALLVFISLKK